MEFENSVILCGVIENKYELKSGEGKNGSWTLQSFKMRTETTYNGNTKKEYHSCSAWRDEANAVALLDEGDWLKVEGSIQTRSYEDKKGVRKWITQINVKNVTPGTASTQIEMDLSDEIPF